VTEKNANYTLREKHEKSTERQEVVWAAWDPHLNLNTRHVNGFKSAFSRAGGGKTTKKKGVQYLPKRV